MKCYKITPSGDTRLDSLYIQSQNDTWSDALGQVEVSLDAQFNDKDWCDIKVIIECVELTDEEWELAVENGKWLTS